MDRIQQYLLSITAAAVICAIANTLAGKKSSCATVIKLLSGLFLSLCVISPLVSFEGIDLSYFADSLTVEAQAASSYGEIMASDAAGEIIKERTQAYILDKAASMDMDIEVEVSLDSATPPNPSSVVIKGSVSPYSKEVLSQYIADNLAIAKEDQHWS